MEALHPENESNTNQSAMSRLTSQLRNMARSSPTSPSISSSSEDSDDLTDDEEEGAVVNSSNVIDYLLPGQKQDLACRLLLSEEDGLNRDLSNLTLVAPETQARLEALLEVAGVAADGKAFTDPEVLRRLTSSVSSALDEAAAALTRMRSQAGIAGTNHIHDQGTRSLVEACIGGDIAAVRKLLDEGRSVHEPTDEGESLLSLACSAGYYELVQVLLAMNANVEDRGSKGDCTPLMEASSGGFVDIVKLLLQHGANVNAQSSSGNTALHYACCGGYEDVVLVLLDHNADIEHQNENGHTPLMEAASGGHGSVALILLERGAGINTHSSEFKESALTLACYKGHVDMVRFLLEKGADQEHKTDEMHTALMEASMDGHVEVAKLLLEHGAQVNMPADSFESPLTLAACGSHVDLAHLLIDHGANLEEVNDEGYTPLMEAAREGYLPMVALLLEHGANINAQTEETQETALTLACCGGFKEVVAFLLEGGADIELGASTPLMEAATEGHVELVRFLIEKVPKVDAATATGDTALTYAAENGHTGVAEVLLEAGAELEHESEGGRTPLMKAARAGHRCTVEFLIRRGANVNKTTTNNDHNVLSLACAGGHTEVVELLLAYGGDPSYKLKDNSSMLIEASKGGHTAVCLLLMDTPLQAALIDNAPHPAGFATPVGSPNGHMPPVTPVRACQHAYPRDHHLPLSHECTHACPHVAPVPECFGHSCNLSSPPPPVVQPSSSATYSFSSIPSTFVAPPFPNNAGPVPPVASPSEFMVPNLPISLPSSTSPLANLTPADLQSLAQALSFSASVNSLNNPADVAVSTSATVAENLGIAATVNFPVIDPNLSSMASPELSLGAIPMPTAISTTVVTSGARTVTSTGVQTEDAISMIHRLTNSVHQLSALQNFAASHNLELVNLGEITIPPNPFQLNVAQDDGIMVAEPARPLQDTLPHVTREEPIGECSPPIDIPQVPALPPQSPVSPPLHPAIDLNQQTESNHDTALTIACAGGHDDLVQLLIAKGADIEHRDKKGCTPLILAATAGHGSTCKILLDHGSDIEAQSDRTKDTALSLACSSGRQEVVELLLARGSNYEHRNVSDYTPLSLAASGGYVGIIKVLLNHGAEINSRTGSKLGISPLMLAAMNGHVAAVKLLLDMGSDVNAQIETNRNTALTLACFQGRQEVVGLLLDRKANVEHRAKTGLTPLMEAASGGYVEVGRVLIDRGADVNAPPVPSSRDTALTIAADKGHCKFVELLVHKGASVDVKNKKGCCPLWLAAYGGHLDVVQLLAKEGGDLDSQDNRGLSCLMAAFRKGHVKVIKWLVKHVTQFPADPDCKRFMQTVSDKDLLKKLQECMEIIISAKERQAAEANKNASILLEELDHEKEREERRKAAAAKKRDKKKRKKKKRAEQEMEVENDQQDDYMDDDEVEIVKNEKNKVKCLENGIGMNGIQIKDDEKRRMIINEEKPIKTNADNRIKSSNAISKKEKKDKVKERFIAKHREERRVPLTDNLDSLNTVVITSAVSVVASIRPTDTISTTTVAEITKAVATSIISSSKSSRPHDSLSINADVAATMATAVAQCAIITLPSSGGTGSSGSATSPKKNKRPEEGWKEVTRRSKKIQIPAALISRVIGRGGCNVNTIRECTGAHIDIDTNRKKPNGDCMVTIKGSQQSTRQAYNLIDGLIKDPDRDVSEILPARPKKLDNPPVIPPSVQKPSPPNSTLVPTSKSAFGNSLGRSMSSSAAYNHHQQQQPVQRRLSTGTPASTAQHSHVSLKTAPKSAAPSQSTNRLPPRMGGPSAVATNTAQSGTKPEIAPMGWGGIVVAPQNGANNKITKVTPLQNSSSSPVSSTKQRSSVSKLAVTMAKSPVARQLFPATTSAAVVTKVLPKPIGSNRPTRAPSVSTKAITQTTQSTRTTPSITANHNATDSGSTLNSFFTQMVTQVRSPMIWNEPNGGICRTSTGDTVVTTVASMISKSPLTVNSKSDVLAVSQVTVVAQTSNPTSPSFNKGPSPTPSLSPSSNKSDSPSPGTVGEERPHLNPIGCERAHKRSSSASLPPVPGLAGFLPDPGTQSVWGFGYSTSNTSSSAWPATSHQQNPDWTSSSSVSQSQSNVNQNDEEFVEIGPNDNLQSVLERLCLSSYLSSFQKNEIDLDALMLMSEQDYADIGLPKGPRVKLMKTTLRTNGSNASRGQPSVNHVGMVNSNPQNLWNPPPVIAAGVLPIANSTVRPTPLLTDALRFPPQQIIQPTWRPWSRTDQ